MNNINEVDTQSTVEIDGMLWMVEEGLIAVKPLTNKPNNNPSPNRNVQYGAWHGCRYSNIISSSGKYHVVIFLANTREALVPPNPKLLLIAILISCLYTSSVTNLKTR